MANRNRHTCSILTHALRLVVVAFGAMLLSCSASQRLAVLLARHPELQRDSTIVLSAVRVIEADSAALDFTLSDIRSLGNHTPDTDSPEQSTPCKVTHIEHLTVETKTGAVATIVPRSREEFSLKVKSKADTIVVRDTVILPSYVTQVVREDKIVYRQHRWQRLFTGVGIGFVGLITILLGIKIFKWIRTFRLL